MYVLATVRKLFNNVWTYLYSSQCVLKYQIPSQYRNMALLALRTWMEDIRNRCFVLLCVRLTCEQVF